ncbi:MAG: hypothetical protein NTV68_09450 [Methanomicrobiales archaeon]|nr:hypothetical protein [Methanomicrobiales archaeon]
MTDNQKPRDCKAAYTDAKAAADAMTKDAGVKAQNASTNAKAGASKRGPGNSKIDPHNMDSDVTTSMNHMKLTCPQCGKSTLRAEFPDQYEAWIKLDLVKSDHIQPQDQYIYI